MDAVEYLFNCELYLLLQYTVNYEKKQRLVTYKQLGALTLVLDTNSNPYYLEIGNNVSLDGTR